eukprot:CAMPEP_0177666158 /NCGR_PEP_ID=MMETSP0447-20121125/21435_1 /TAXON_ID=0 /ORGANISM="Stygamoeba regulata, Strain BSH-02190019" /LENGTH=1372 /DNA_ID=CAMNT_0019172293 /DNA_START=454 /DNA_END=4572 /DNA_ORIENTATION=-
MPSHKAVVVGITYHSGDKRYWLPGCAGDVNLALDYCKDVLKFQEENIRVLTDTEDNLNTINWPSKENILNSLKWLVEGAQPHDKLFFHFSGHGSQDVNKTGEHMDLADGMEELICPADVQWVTTKNGWDNVILSSDVKKIFQVIPKETELGIVLDNCHSGTMCRTVGAMKPNAPGKPKIRSRFMPPPDQEVLTRQLTLPVNTPCRSLCHRENGTPKEQQRAAKRNRRRRRKELDDDDEKVERATPAYATVFASCRSDQTAADATIDGKHYGAFSFFFYKLMTREHGKLTNKVAVESVRKILKEKEFQQIAQLDATLDKDDKYFMSDTKSDTPVEIVDPLQFDSNDHPLGDFLDSLVRHDKTLPPRTVKMTMEAKEKMITAGIKTVAQARALDEERYFELGVKIGVKNVILRNLMRLETKRALPSEGGAGASKKQQLDLRWLLKAKIDVWGDDEGAAEAVEITDTALPAKVTSIPTAIGAEQQRQMERDMEEKRRLEAEREQAETQADQLVLDEVSGEVYAPDDRGVENLVYLPTSDAKSVLTNLRKRSLKDIIYTYCGNVLVAVNPYKDMPLYSLEVARGYVGKSIGDMPPHLYAIAEAAYRALRLDGLSKSIAVIGVSGAGKSEATKYILQYVAAFTQQTDETKRLKLMESLPLMEAFGNSKTVLNNNSSRFGKYVEVVVDGDGNILGAVISPFLLEKSRVVYQNLDERNYHIFYQMVYGASREERTRYGLLSRPEDYYYLSQSGCMTVHKIDDTLEWGKTKDRMNWLHLSQQMQDSIFSTISAVLLLGNVKFNNSGVENKELLAKIAQLLQVDQAALQRSLEERRMKTLTSEEGGNAQDSQLVLKLRPAQAIHVRDALAKELYFRVFALIVRLVNNECSSAGFVEEGQLTEEELETNRQRMRFLPSLGVLDVFGFENSDQKNSFEQFLINFANEKLQYQYYHNVMLLQHLEYTQQSIKFTENAFPDNLSCLELIESLLATLSDLCKYPRATDQRFIELATIQNGKHPHYLTRPTITGPDDKPIPRFAIRHYAGAVCYDVDGFLDKNKDMVPTDAEEMMLGSASQYVRDLFSPDNTLACTLEDRFETTHKERETKISESEVGGAHDPMAEEPKAKVTLGDQFEDEINSLYSRIAQNQTFFINCIRSNKRKIPNTFEPPLVLKQMKYSGMLDVLHIYRLGFPISFLFCAFFERYAPLAPSSQGKVLSAEEEEKQKAEVVRAVLKELGCDAALYQVGETKVFMKHDLFLDLEARLSRSTTRGIAAPLQAGASPAPALPQVPAGAAAAPSPSAPPAASLSPSAAAMLDYLVGECGGRRCEVVRDVCGRLDAANLLQDPRLMLGLTRDEWAQLGVPLGVRNALLVHAWLRQGGGQ